MKNKTLFDQKTLFHTLLLFGMNAHKKHKILLKNYFKNCMGKKIAKPFRSLLILNAFPILNKLSLYIQRNLYVLYLMNLSILPIKRRYWMMEYDKTLLVNVVYFQNKHNPIFIFLHY